MGKILLSVGLVAFGLACAAPTLQDQRSAASATSVRSSAAVTRSGAPRRVVLISVAGLEANHFLNAFGHVAAPGDIVQMPRLAELAGSGAVGLRAQPPIPGSTYASHATLVTGKRPKRHGVIADSTLEETGTRSQPFWDNRLLKGNALWDAAIGRGVLSLGWPTTTGARIELVVPDLEPEDASASWLTAVGRHASPVLMQKLQSLEQAAASSAAEMASGDAKSASRRWPTPAEKDAAFAELACQIAASDRDPSLWLIRLNQTADSDVRHGVGSLAANRALARADQAIGRIVDCLRDAERLAETALFVVGDVRYEPVHTRVDPNTVLVREGLIGRDPRSSTGARSWLAMVRSQGRSAYVYARDAGNAVSARDILTRVAEGTGAFEVVPARALAEAGGDPQAWFGLAAKPGFEIGNSLTGPLLRPSQARAAAGGFGFQDSQTTSVGFLAWGRGIRSGVRLPELAFEDIAPTIASLLGLRLDDDLDGQPLLGILRAAVPPPPPGPKRLGGDSDGDVGRVLRDLGGGRDLEDE